MKKIIRLFVFLLFIFIIASCQSNTGGEESFQEEKQKLSEAMTKAKEANFVTITSTATMLNKEVQLIQKNRITKANTLTHYLSGVLDSGYTLTYENNTYHLEGNGINETPTYDENSHFLYNSLGIGFLFDLNYKDGIDLNFKNKNQAIFEYIVNSEKTIFENVNYDFNQKYTYEEHCSIEIKIFFSTTISSIEIDLTNAYPNQLTSLNYEYNFSFDEFKVGGSYDTSFEISTASTMESYIIEMNEEYGDSIFIHSGSFDMLIDAGQYEDGPYIEEFVEQHCEDHVLDVLIVTHAHADHYGGFCNGALNSIEEIKLIIDYGYQDSNYYEKVKKSYIQKGATYYPIYNCINELEGASRKYRFSSDLTLELIDTGQYALPYKSLPSNANQNDYSVVCRVDFGSNSYLYTGDLSGDYDQTILKQNIENMTVMKLAHHGARSHNSNSSVFLNYVNPAICVVSAAITADPFGQAHPTQTIISRVLNLPKISKTHQIYYNGTMGTIHLVDNGVDLPTVSGLGAHKGYYYKGQKVTGEEDKNYTETILYAGR